MENNNTGVIVASLLNNSVELSSPAENMERTFSDNLNIVLYILFLIVGLPVNLSTLLYMIRRFRHANSFLLLLHINLNISDVLVLGVYTTGHVIWHLTIEWRGGDTMCRAMRFADQFVFSISSNIMVCIALYRLYALRYPVLVSAEGHRRIPRMLLAAWGIAALVALPQLFVWRKFTLNGFTQCVVVWVERIHTNTTQPDDVVAMKVYNGVHVVAIFYIPLVILLVCYVLILKDIYTTLQCDADNTSVLYMAEMSRLSTNSRLRLGKKQPSASLVSVTTRPLRGQDRLKRAKVRSLRITLLLILTYAITWLPYNLLSWLLMFSMETYRELEDVLYFLHSFVVLNSVINPFIYGRCQGVLMLFPCRDKKNEKTKKPWCWLLSK